MTRSALAKRIARKLKEWEGSMLTEKTAMEILDVCEKAGMQPPSTWVQSPMPGLQVLGNAWDKPVAKKRRSMAEISESIRKNNRRRP